MADNNEIIGGIGVNVSADFSDLGADFDAAVALAVSQGQTLAEAIQSAMATPDVTPVTDALESIAPAAQSAAEQLSLFGAAADNIPFADAAGQLNLFTTEIEPFTAGVQAAGEAAQAAGAPIHDLGEHAKEAHEGAHSLLETLLEFTGIEIGIEALKEFASECVEVYANVQMVTRALTVLGGSAEDADRTIERLKAMATADALSFPQLLTARVRMQAAGIELERIPALLEAAAGPSKAFGTDIDTVAFKLTTMITNGTMASRSLNSIGLSAQQMADVMGVALGEVTKQFKAMDQASRQEVIIEALHKFAGVVATDSGNIKDQWQNLKNQADFLFDAIGKSIAPAALEFIKFATDAIRNIEYLANGLRALTPDFLGARDAVMLFSIAVTALSTKGLVVAAFEIIELANAAVTLARSLQQADSAILAAEKSFEAFAARANQIIPATGEFRDKLRELNQQLANSGDQVAYRHAVEALVDSFHKATGFVADTATGIHTFTLAVKESTEAADKFKPFNFGDVSGGASGAQIASAIILQTFKDQESAIQKTIAEFAKYHEELAANADAFKMDTAVPQLNAVQLGIGNVSKMLNDSGQDAKQWSATLSTGAQAALGPIAALDRVMKSLGQRDELSALQQYARNVDDINTALAGTAITASRAGDMMKEAWLKAHPDITKADDEIQRITQHMADLREAQQMGIISSAQMSTDMVKDLEKLSPVVRQVSQEMNQMFNSINSGIASDIVHWKGMASTVTSIFQTLGEGILKIMITALFGPIEKQIAAEVTAWVAAHLHIGTAAAAASATEATAATTASTASTTAAAASTAAVKLAAAAQIASWAGVAAAAAFAATAAIPIIGLGLAPAAAATAFGEVMSFEGLAAFQEGGTVGGALGSPQMILAHGGEHVFTADQMNNRVALPSIGGSSSSFSASTVNNSGGDIHLNFDGAHFYGTPGKPFVDKIMNSAVKQARRINAKW
jgi:hypothetical protein